ncbi:MAG: glycosyltransferase [Candidatus Aerophobetes bacterium]|nr:glycosyltransferase [Candidatus Aerophobetes bacterium]
MKVCFVSDQAFPAFGGEGISTRNLCLNLSKRRHKIVLLTSQVKNPPLVREVEIYRFFSLPIPVKRGYLAFPSGKRIFSILRDEKIQLLHINLPTYLGWQALRAGRKMGIPVVLGFHVQVGNVIRHHLLLFFFEKVVEGWFSYFFKAPDLVVTPSFFARDILRQYTHKPIEVISNGVDLEKFSLQKITSEDRERFRKRYSLESSSLLLYVGRLSYEKNMGYLLKIMQNLKIGKDVRLLIVGEGELKDALRKKIKRLKMHCRIILTGHLKDKDLLCAYAETDIFILSSFMELQSIATLEAMAMKNAIMVGRSKENAAQELVREGVNGYTFSLEDPRDAAGKIHTILSDARLKRGMQEKSFKMVRQHDLQKTVSILETVYQRLIRSHKL